MYGVQELPRCLHSKRLVYQFSCNLCEEQGKAAHYFGELSRSLFERIPEHKKQIEKRDIESGMMKHHEENHDEEKNTNEDIKKSIRTLRLKYLKKRKNKESQGLGKRNN